VTGDFVEDVRARVEHANRTGFKAAAIDVQALEHVLFVLDHPPVVIPGSMLNGDELNRFLAECPIDAAIIRAEVER